MGSTAGTGPAISETDTQEPQCKQSAFAGVGPGFWSENGHRWVPLNPNKQYQVKILQFSQISKETCESLTV